MTDLRCSVQSRSLGELPGGSATAADRFVLAELPLPWPAKIEDHPLLAGPQRPDAGLGTTRVLGIRRAAEAGSATTSKLLVYSRTPGAPFDGFRGFEADVPNEQLAERLKSVLQGDSSGLRPVDATQDVLLCTHGSRDRCCGQAGSLLFLELAGRLPAGVRLWRTSHTGGHRFAPTGVSFPDGLTWAFLDAHLLAGIVDRSIDPAELHSHLRGCAGFDGPDQVADGAAFAKVGWEWIDQPRTTVTTVLASAASRVEREVYVAGPRRQFTVTVIEDDPVPVPPCGEPLTEATKTSPQFVVTAVTEHVTAGST